MSDPGAASNPKAEGHPLREGVAVPPDLPASSLASYRPGSARTAPIAPSVRPSLWDAVQAPEPLPPTDGPGTAGKYTPGGRPAAPGFSLRRLVGRGGFGEVWEASQASLGRTVAVKRLRDDAVQQAARAGKLEAISIAFQQEALVAAALDHPNIVPVHDLGTDEDGLPLLAMKLVRGRPWDALLAEDFVRLGVADFLEAHIPILISVCQAVAFAHSRGVVHRDLKPTQVMIGEFGEVYLMDWGLAMLYDPGRLRDADLRPEEIAPTPAAATSPAGTAAFMAPEQTEPTAAGIGPWTDVFLLGATLYYILTGWPPYHAEDARKAFYEASQCRPTPVNLRGRGADAPEGLARIASRAMAADPKARYATASEMLADLRDWVTGATNRRASEATAREVEDRLRTAATHQDFVTLNALVADAAEAWPGNPRMPELRRRVQSGWARAALRQGDLSLARAQAEALAPGPERTDLLDLIAARQGRLRRLARQRRVAVTVAVLLLAGYAASLWLGQRKDAAAALEARNANEELENINAELRRERDAVRRERDLARAARSDAEGLVGYMLGSMRRDLLKIGRTDVLGGPTEMAVAYFNRLPDEHRTPATVAAHARALRQRAHLLEELGDTGGALDHYTSATALLRPLAPTELMTDEIAEEFARNLDEAADMAQRLGQRGQADRYLDEMFALLEPRAKGAAPPPALLHQYARALHGRASLISRTEPDRALPILEEALGVMKRVLLAQPGDAEMRHTLALTYSRLSETHGLAANAEEEGRNARLALDEFEAIWRENKDDIRYLAGVVHHRMRVADFLVGQRRDREALEVLSTAFEESEQLVAYDPENMTYLGNQLMFFDIGATALLNLGFLGPALHNRLLAVEVAEEFVRREGKPGNANHTLSLMWERTATVQRLMGDDVGAMESLDRAEAAVRPLLELPSPPPFWRRQLIVLDERRGNVAMDAQRYTAAVAFFERFRQDSLAASQASETETLGTSDYFIGGFKAMMAYIRLGEPQEAVRVGRETLARADALLAAGDARARIAQPIVPMVKVTLAFALNAEGKTGEAFSLLEANVQHLTPQLKRVPLEVRPEVELMMLSDPECWQHLMDQIADPAEP